LNKQNAAARTRGSAIAEGPRVSGTLYWALSINEVSAVGQYNI